MVIIRVKGNIPPQQAEVVAEEIRRQATTGVIALPNFCELLNEVPADEEITVVRETARAAKNDDLILRGKALRDLRGIKDVLMAQGDPILASIINRTIECIENQPAVAGPEDQLAQAMEYINETKHCATCKHVHISGKPCEAEEYDCMACDWVECICKHCYDHDKWEWKGAADHAGG